MVGWFGAWRGKADHFATFQNGVKRACLQGISSPFCCADSAHCGPLSFLGRADVCKATKATNNNKIKHLLSSFTSFAFVCCLITPTQTTQHTHSHTHAHAHTRTHAHTHTQTNKHTHTQSRSSVLAFSACPLEMGQGGWFPNHLQKESDSGHNMSGVGDL